MRRQIAFAMDCGVSAVLVAPMIAGFANANTLVREHPEVAFMAHPTMGGAARIAPPLLIGKLFRLIGMDAVVRADTEAILVTLVDVPMVAVATVTRVVTAWERSRAPIVRPAIGDRHGHPVIFDRALFDALRGAPPDVGAKSVVRAHEHDLLNVPVDDDGCLVDVDTPQEYLKLREQ